MRTTKQALRLWENLKQKFNNRYIEVVKFNKSEQKGVKLIA